MSSREVFLVEHVHILEGGEEDVKIVGIYSTREAAQQAVNRLQLQPGFRDAPDGFTIDLYWVDQDHWEGGYITARGKPE
jgi:homoserine kinase type II